MKYFAHRDFDLTLKLFIRSFHSIMGSRNLFVSKLVKNNYIRSFFGNKGLHLSWRPLKTLTSGIRIATESFQH